MNQSEINRRAARNKPYQYPSRARELTESTAVAARTSSIERSPRKKYASRLEQLRPQASFCKTTRDHPPSKKDRRAPQRRPFVSLADHAPLRAKHVRCLIR